jgi:dipeptidyl-peptidase-3
MASGRDLAAFILKSGVETGDLHVERILQSLTPQQVKYATYLALASWAGAPILLDQVSRESPGIHAFLSAFYSQYPRPALEAAVAAKDGPLFLLLEYAATFFYNGGNYLGFGDTKVIPRVAKADLVALVAPYPDVAAKLADVVDAIYDDTDSLLTLGWAPGSVTAYYEPRDFTAAEGEAIDNLLKAAKIRPNNTKVTRLSDRYDVRRISIEIDDVGLQIGEVNGLPVFVTKGLHSETLKKVNKWLSLAKDAALNAAEAEALAALIRHWETGSVEEHIQYSELWVDDSDPIVEFHHGVVEDSRDPAGHRAEYESLVAAVDPEESRFLHDFVGRASAILPLLPYPRCYERKSFTPPSYNAINILTFCVSLMPIGINLPNYDEVRLTKGFKNVSLSNVMNALPVTPEKVPFIPNEQLPEFIELFYRQNVLSVAAHELYGHGSGTLLKQEDVAGGQIRSLIDPDKVVDTFWGEGETWQGVFGGLSNAWEECRAETTALYLAFKDEVLDMYGVAPEQRLSFKVVSTLDMLHSAIKGLPCYDPSGGQWLQPHSRARFVILRVAVEWGKGAVSVRQVDGTYKIFVDKDNLDGLIEAVTKLLKHLNYYKAARLLDEATRFMNEIGTPDDFWLDVRKQAELLKRPSAVDCGAVLKKTDDGYTLARSGAETATVLDVFGSIVENIRLALE